MNNDNAWKIPSVRKSDIEELRQLGFGLPNGFLYYLELEAEFDFSPLLYNPSFPMSNLEKTIKDINLSPDRDITLLTFGDGRAALRYCLGWFMSENGIKYKTFKEAVIELLANSILEINQPQYYISSLDWERGIECLCKFIDLVKEKL